MFIVLLFALPPDIYPTASLHTFCSCLTTPSISHLSHPPSLVPICCSKAERRSLPNLLCSREPGGECGCYPQWDMEREKPLQHQGKGNAGLSFTSFCCSLVLPSTGCMNYATASGTGSILLSGVFFTASTPRGCARGILVALPLMLPSWMTTMKFVGGDHKAVIEKSLTPQGTSIWGSNCYSVPLYAHKLLKQ